MRIGPRHADCTLDNYNVDDNNREAYEACKSVIEEPASLILSGKVGIGKTHLLVAIAKVVNRKIKSGKVRYWTALELVQKLRQNYDDPGIIDSINKTPLFILDDLGAERTTEFILEIIEEVIDYRYRFCRPTIVGTNLSLEELAERYGNRVLSRLMGDGKFIRIAGKDRRLD